MEATRSRSQSPIAKCKTKGQTSDCGESGDDNNDQIKTRKRSQKNKQKIQAIEKDLEKNGNGIAKKDTMEFSNQLEDINNSEQCNEVTNGNGTENSSNVSCQDDEENVENNNLNNEQEDKGQFDTILDPPNEVEPLSVTENNKNGDLKEKDQENFICTTINEVQHRMPNVDTRTEEEPKNMIEKEPENLEDKRNSNNLPEVNNVSLIHTNGDDTTNGSSFQDGTEANDSHENSIYEDASISDENLIQTSFDAASKKDASFTDKLSSFIGKWNTISPAQSPRQVDSEVSSSKKFNSPVASDSKFVPHPYLSKISGRPGIKEKLNSEHITNGKDVETPKNMKLTLDDSFRVKSDPPRRNQEDPQENSVLRKYKGKRCLNTFDESEDGDDTSIVNSKRRKLDENLSKPGFLGSILLSPFKKRPLNVDETSKLTNSQSKISRFLSPFWFWKKTATVEEDPK